MSTPTDASADPRVVIAIAHVVLGDGTIVAQIESVKIGGGTQTVTVDGVPEERQHPTLDLWHCRLISPDRMISDELRSAETYEEAVEIGLAYAQRRIKHAERVAELAADLKDG